MKKINEQETRYYRIPEKIVQKHQKNRLLQDMLVISCGYRSGKHPEIGHNVSKQSNEEYLIQYCTEGEGWYEVEGKRFVIRQGDLMICSNWTSHKYGTSDDNPWTVSWVYFVGEQGEYYMHMLRKNNFFDVVHIGLDIKIETYFHEILRNMEKGYALQYHLHSANVLRSLLSYVQLKSEVNMINKAKRFEDILNYMKDSVDKNITLDEMAQSFHLSKDHFTKLFKRQYGFTPIDYFIHMKMQKACALLTTTQEPIKVIAKQLGYQDYYYFSKLFKNKIGISPKHYKKQFKQNSND